MASTRAGTSSPRSTFPFLKGLFGKRKAPVAAVSPAPKPAAPRVRPPRAPPEEDPVRDFSALLEVNLSAQPPPIDVVEGDEALAERVLTHFREKAPALEALPASSLQVLEVVAQPDATHQALTTIISRDPALTASVLQVANSVYYQAAQSIHSLRQAINRLGQKEVARVAGIVSARSLFNPRLREERSLFGARFIALREQAVTIAFAASWLSLECPGTQPDHAFLGGLLHDVGKALALRSVSALVLAQALPTVPDAATIDRVIEQVHVEMGAEAHRIWRLPANLQLLAAHHHDSGREDFNAELHVVRLVSALESWSALRRPQSPWEVLESVRALRLRVSQVRMLRIELSRAAHNAQNLLSKA